MAALGAAVPGVLTMMQKLEKAWDDVDRIFTLSPSPKTFDEFMGKYSRAAGLGDFITDLIKVAFSTPRKTRTISAQAIKDTLFNILSMLHIRQRHDLVRFILHLEGPKSKKSIVPRALMGLFVFGLIDLDTVPFSEWMKMTGVGERAYILEFLSLLDSGDEIEVYSNVNKAVETIDDTHVIPDSLFLASSIPDGAKNVIILDSFPAEDPWKNLQSSIDRKDTITSKPIFWYAYVIRNYNPAVPGSTVSSTSTQAWADPVSAPSAASPAAPSAASPDTTTVKCIGIVDGEKQYIFGYNFPQYDKQYDDTHAWNVYIKDPYAQYASVFQALTRNADTSIISRVTLEHRMLIYIHVLVMGMYGEQRNFYALNVGLPDDSIQDALVAGKTCEDYLLLLKNNGGAALGIDSGAMDGAVMARLARAHLKLMRKNPYFIFPGAITDDFEDALDSTCPVKYQWVFENKNLSSHQEWVTQMTDEINLIENGTNTTKTDLGVFRRIAHFMEHNFQLGSPDRSVLQKFKKNVDVGAKVDNDDNKHISLNLQDHGQFKNIFNTSSKLLSFLVGDPTLKRLKTAMETYFAGNWHPDEVFGKYIVHDKGTGTYEVRDSIQMLIDNDATDRSEDITSVAERTASNSSASSSNKSWDPEDTLPRVPGALDSAQTKKTEGGGVVVEHLPRIDELKSVLQTREQEIHRSQGGLQKILESLEALKTMKDMSTEDGNKKVEAMKRDIAAASATFTSEFNALKTDVDGLNAELQTSHDAAGAQKLKFEGELKTEHDKNVKQALDLADAVKKEAECLAQKVLDDAAIQKLTGERDDLAAQLAALNLELADSKAREKTHEGTIASLQDNVKVLEADIATLKLEIADLNSQKTNLLGIDASRQAGLDELANVKAELAAALASAAQLELDKQALEAEKLSLTTTLSASGADLTTEHLERLKLYEEMTKYKATITQYERELKEIIEKVKKATLEHENLTNGCIWKIQDKVDVQIQGEFTDSRLLALLKTGEYLNFLNAVKVKTPTKKPFNDPALFLTYESIGGTWQMFVEPALMDKKLTTALMAQKLLDDILLFQTIETHNVHIANTYATKHFRDFMDVFKCYELDPTTKMITSITGF